MTAGRMRSTLCSRSRRRIRHRRVRSRLLTRGRCCLEISITRVEMDIETLTRTLFSRLRHAFFVKYFRIKVFNARATKVVFDTARFRRVRVGMSAKLCSTRGKIRFCYHRGRDTPANDCCSLLSSTKLSPPNADLFSLPFPIVAVLPSLKTLFHFDGVLLPLLKPGPEDWMGEP